MSSFNPCFFGLFCNLKREQQGRSYLFVSILVFLDFSATRYVTVVRPTPAPEVSILVFLDFSATLMWRKPVMSWSGFNPCFFGLFCNEACRDEVEQLKLVSILVFLDFSATRRWEELGENTILFQSLFFWTFLQRGVHRRNIPT